MTELSREEKALLKKQAEDAEALVKVVMVWLPLFFLWAMFMEIIFRRDNNNV
jgi:hypothetical protein